MLSSSERARILEFASNNVPVRSIVAMLKADRGSGSYVHEKDVRNVWTRHQHSRSQGMPDVVRLLESVEASGTWKAVWHFNESSMVHITCIANLYPEILTICF